MPTWHRTSGGTVPARTPFRASDRAWSRSSAGVSRTSSASRSTSSSTCFRPWAIDQEIPARRQGSNLTLRSTSSFEIGPHSCVETAPGFAALGARCGRCCCSAHYPWDGVATAPHGCEGRSRALGKTRPFPEKLFDHPPMGLFRNLTGFGGRDMAVDLGTANTLVYVRGRGIVLSEPSVVAVDARSGEVHAVGVDAKRMLGRTPGTIRAIRPLKDGVIADFDVTEEMLRHFIQRVHQNRFAHPRVVVCVPSGVTGVEKRAVEEACLSAGARRAYLMEEPMPAAIGAGLPVAEPTGSMVLDVGGGTSEVAVISLGGIVVSESIRIGGDEQDEAIVNYCKHEHKLLIGQQTAEEVKLEIGSATHLPEEVTTEIRGRDMVTGLPKTILLTSLEVRSALEEPVNQIVAAVKDTLDRTPPELAGDIMDRGIILAGGGSLLQGMDQRLRDECQMPAQVTESPLTCVAVGSGRSLEEFEVIHRMSRNSHRRLVATG